MNALKLENNEHHFIFHLQPLILMITLHPPPLHPPPPLICLLLRRISFDIGGGGGEGGGDEGEKTDIREGSADMLYDNHLA